MNQYVLNKDVHKPIVKNVDQLHLSASRYGISHHTKKERNKIKPIRLLHI